MGEGTQGGGAGGLQQGGFQGLWYSRGEVTQSGEAISICLCEGCVGGAAHCCYAQACQHSIAAVLKTQATLVLPAMALVSYILWVGHCYVAACM